VINRLDNISHVVGPVEILSVRKVLPQGSFDGGIDRKRSLVQLYTDPGGVRTLAVAEIWGKDPSRADNPW
jgi:hypothetical protein